MPKASAATEPKLLEVTLNVEKPAAQSTVHLVSGNIDFVNGVATVTEEQYKELLAANIVKEVK